MSTGTGHFTGVVPPVVTPLTAEGAVDVASLERLVGHLIGPVSPACSRWAVPARPPI